MDEVIAMGQHMVQATRKGEPFRRVFWLGGRPAAQNKDERSPEILSFGDHPWKVIRTSVWGMSVPKTLALATVSGIVLPGAPGSWRVSIDTMAAHIFHVAGAWIVVCSVISMGEVVRVVRFGNWPAALVVAILPWFFKESEGLCITGSVLGALICILSLPRGRIKEKYGLWQRYVR